MGTLTEVRRRLYFSGNFASWLCFGAILLVAALLRFSHLEIAHFGLDQSRAALNVWEIAREGKFHSYYFLLTGGYHNFPLPLYLWAPAFLVSTHIHALLIWNIVLNLGSVALCWFFARRYGSWPVAAVATLLLACSPWHAFFANRIWNNVLMSLFVMIWLFGTAFAYYERRTRWWALSWGTAVLLVQIHTSGVIFLFSSGVLWLLAGREGRSWKWALLGILLALIPALPWLAAHLNGEIAFQTERFPFIGEGKRSLRFNVQPIFEILTTNFWQRSFQGGNMAALARLFRPLEILFVPILIVYAISVIRVYGASWRGPQERLNQILAAWFLLPLVFFPIVSYEDNTLVYLLPLLPAPFLAVAFSWNRLRGRWCTISLLAITLLCVLQARVVWGSAQYIRDAEAAGDEMIWAAGGYTPLNRQRAIARAAKETVESGEASEIFHLIRPVYTVEHETLAYALPLLSGMPARILDRSEPHFVFPAQPSVWFLDTQNAAWPTQYTMAEEIQAIGQYRLYLLPGEAGPAPEFSLPERPTFDNGIQLLGYDGVPCDGNWRLHWTPIPAVENEVPVHFFVHLLDEAGQVLAQKDVRSYDRPYWRDGDHIVTSFDFGPGVRRTIHCERENWALLFFGGNEYHGPWRQICHR